MSIIRGESGDIPSLADYMERRHRFSKDFPHHSHVFFEVWMTAPAEIAEEVAQEKAVFEDLNRQVSEKLLSESTLKDYISQEAALYYLTFIQQLFRSYYLGPADLKEPAVWPANMKMTSKRSFIS